MKWFYAWKYRRAVRDLMKWREAGRIESFKMAQVEVVLIDECLRLANKAGLSA